MKLTLITVVAGGFGLIGFASPFLNLDFESPHLSAVLASAPIPTTSDAIPGWSVMYGANPGDRVFYNSQAISSISATLWSNRPGGLFEGSGAFHFSLQSGWDNTVGKMVSVSLSQKAVVPSTASSLTFIGWLLPDRSLFSVSMDGQEVPFVELERRQHSSIYGIDVSSWQGKEAELRFTMAPPAFEIAVANLDHIEFSPLALVPEPGSLTLLAVGGAAVWPLLRRRRR